MRDRGDLGVHTAEGFRYHAKVIAIEPELDVALIKIGDDKNPVKDLKYFDVLDAVRRPTAEPGTGILGFSNQFQIATRDEPVSVQQGVIPSYAKLPGKIATFDAPSAAPVYLLDPIT